MTVGSTTYENANISMAGGNTILSSTRGLLFVSAGAGYGPLSASVPSITSSLLGTASWASNVVSASYALSASFSPGGAAATYTSSLYGTASWANSASWSPVPDYTSSLYGTASWAIDVVNGGTPTYTSSLYGTASWAQTASWANNVPASVLWTGSALLLTGSGIQTPLKILSAIDNFSQVYNQNMSNGGTASTDFVATCNMGDDTTLYVDLGINGSSYSGSFVGLAHDAYLYTTGSNFYVGNVTPGKSLYLFAGGSSTTGSVAISSTAITTALPILSTYVTLATPTIAAPGITCSFLDAKEYVLLNTGSVTWTFTSSNVPADNVYAQTSVYIANTNTTTNTASLSFPAGWKWIGVVPSAITASKIAYLNLEAFGSNIVAGWGYQY